MIVKTSQILPTQELDGDTVVASVYFNDTDYTNPLVLVLLLTATPGAHYRLVMAWETVDPAHRTIAEEIGTYPNIVSAVEAYQENGGDY